MKYNLGKPQRSNLLFEAIFWLIIFGVFFCGSCALWYVVFRAIGIVV